LCATHLFITCKWEHNWDGPLEDLCERIMTTQLRARHLIWLKLRPNGRLLCVRWWNFMFYSGKRICWLAQQLSA